MAFFVITNIFKVLSTSVKLSLLPNEFPTVAFGFPRVTCGEVTTPAKIRCFCLLKNKNKKLQLSIDFPLLLLHSARPVGKLEASNLSSSKRLKAGR